MKKGLPEFLVPEPSRYAWWSSLRAMAQPVPVRSLASPVFFKNKPVATRRVPYKGISSSGVLHVLCLFAIVRLSVLFSGPTDDLDLQPTPPTVIYYYAHTPPPPVQHSPEIKPPGPGARPGEGIHVAAPPKLGATAPHPQLTAVMKFPHPDSKRQTILQPVAPDLKINQDLRLPNLITGNPFVPRLPQERSDQAAPRLASRQADNTKAPDISQNSPVNIANITPTVANPRLILPAQSQSSAPIQRRSAAGGLGSGELAADAPGVVVIGIDPSNSSDVLPVGNRYGSFTVAPPGGQPGSPGGVPNGDLAGGNGSVSGTSAGDASSGVGKGEKGGGGGGAAVDAAMSVSGEVDGKGGAVLRGFNPEALVFRAPVVPKIRDRTLVVTAGPIGGGGLANYGVLHGQVIQTVYIDMAGGPWILEFSELHAAPPDDPPSSAGGVQVQIQLQRAMIPPSPVDKFDFKRTGVPLNTTHPLVVLRGTIQDDGTVGALSILDGPGASSEEVAVAAFKKWKFMPAIKNGHPVPVEILLGIPSQGGANTAEDK